MCQCSILLNNLSVPQLVELCWERARIITFWYEHDTGTGICDRVPLAPSSTRIYFDRPEIAACPDDT